MHRVWRILPPSRVDLFENRLHRAHDKGEADRDQCDNNAERRISHLNAERGEVLADETLRRIDGCQRDAGHGGRHGEGQVDQRIEDATTIEVIADQNPGGQRAENRIGECCGKGCEETDLERREDARIENQFVKSGRTERCRPKRERCERDENDQGQHGQ